MGPVLVIGAGLAGCAAALELADNHREVAMVEKSGAIGGTTRLYGAGYVWWATYGNGSSNMNGLRFL
jgi:succinate dehydrogenase/fumarate reductase flavoprotein subunit